MHKTAFFPKLAGTSIRKNLSSYLPYLLSSAFTIMTFFVMISIAMMPELGDLRGGVYVTSFMAIGCVVVAIFAAVFLFYTNSFLLRRRKRELGLYSILGLEKRHVGRLLGFEALYTTGISLAAGLLGGMVLGKLIFLLMLKITGISPTFTFYVQPMPVLITLALFGAIFLLLYLTNRVRVQVANPIDLLKSDKQGEREPKSYWPITLLGVLALAGGYGVAQAMEQPLYALVFFLGAVLLVILGTYCLFLSGSISLLKRLKKNRRFFYRSRNFVSVSGMLYRMKQNAAGLATICILCAMVLVTVGSTAALYLGCEDALRTRNPTDVSIRANGEKEQSTGEVEQLVKELAGLRGIETSDQFALSFYSSDVVQAGDTFLTASDENLPTTTLLLVPLESFNRWRGTEETLEPQEALVIGSPYRYREERAKFPTGEYRVKEELEGYPPVSLNNVLVEQNLLFVLPTEEDCRQVQNSLMYPGLVTSQEQRQADWYLGFNMGETTEENRSAFLKDLDDGVPEYRFSSIYYDREEWYVMHGSFLFLGLFLGTLFLMATVLLIYYKQVSEGHDDQRRFEILQKVGMSRREVQRTINRQILMVFFLPLGMAFLHLAFAAKAITKVLFVFGIVNATTIYLCLAGTAVIFGVLYLAVYLLTSKAYYRIVK